MLTFEAAPAVPIDYARLAALSHEEIRLAVAASYVSPRVDPRDPVGRQGLVASFNNIPADDIADWRTRMYVIWFCYLFENFFFLSMPLYALEELILEFRAPTVIDYEGNRLATDYAGAGGSEPISDPEHQRQHQWLRPHYDKALSLLHSWQSDQV